MSTTEVDGAHDAEPAAGCADDGLMIPLVPGDRLPAAPAQTWP